MKFIDLFSGIGGFRTALEREGHECLAYSEIDRYAKQSYQAMYDTENEVDLGDITKIDESYFKRFKEENDIVVGGSPCFRRGTIIRTLEGDKPIESIQVGDKVITHNQRFRPVLNTMINHADKIYELKTINGQVTYVTEEHPIYVSEWKGTDYAYPTFVKVKDLDIKRHLIVTHNDDEYSVRLGGSEYLYTIESLEVSDTDEDVYNFEVAEDNTYIANELVVHNCQSFSISGKQRGFEDTRGTLFFEYAKVVKETQPKFFLYENVKGMLSHDNQNTIKTVLKTFNELGYYIDFNVFNSKFYDVPQNRERIYIVGKRMDLVTEPVYHKKRPKKVVIDKIHNWAIDNIYYAKLLPPLKKDVNTRLIDILETNVDEKYYLSDEKTKRLTLNSDLEGKLNKYNNNDVDKVYSKNKLSPTLNTMQGGNRQPKIAVEGFKEIVKIRKYDVDTEKLKDVLRTSKRRKRLSNQKIADELNQPLTKVEHWFRKDRSFSIPEADIWYDLKALIDVRTDEFDKPITTFIEKESEFDTTNRIYDSNAISPTLNTSNKTKITVNNNAQTDTKQKIEVVENKDNEDLSVPKQIAFSFDTIDPKKEVSFDSVNELTDNERQHSKTSDKQKEVKIEKVGNIVENKQTFGGDPQRGRIYNPLGLSPSVNTVQGGGLEPKVIVLGNTAPNAWHNSKNVHGVYGISPTIAARDYKGAKQIAEITTQEILPISTPNIIHKGQFGRRVKNHNEVMFTLTARDKHGIVINPLKDKTDYGWHFEQSVYDPQGVTRTVKANGGSGNIPKAIINKYAKQYQIVKAILSIGCCTFNQLNHLPCYWSFYPFYYSQKPLIKPYVIIDDTQCFDGVRTYEDVAPTLRSERSGLKITELCAIIGSTQKNAYVGDGKESPALKSAMGQGGGHVPMCVFVDYFETLLRFYIRPKVEFGRMGRQAVQTLISFYHVVKDGTTINAYNKTIDNSNISPTLTTRPEGFKTAILPVTNHLRIRKLTPLECWRLQGFSDEQFFKAQNDGVSNSQLYKQAGNSVTVNVVQYIVHHVIKNI